MATGSIFEGYYGGTWMELVAVEDLTDYSDGNNYTI